jgi:hypothetical protein
MNCPASTAVETTAIDIGGLPIVLACDNPSFQAMVEKQYCGFARCADSASTSAALCIDVEVLGEGSLTGEEDVRVWKDGDRWCASRGDFRAEFNLSQRRGSIRLELNPYGLNSILRIVHTIYLAHHQGFLLHAASAVRNGSAFIFSGLSGAGKTTISRCAARDVKLLTDEISHIRREGNEYRACGTPFAGELAKPGHNISAPIAKLFFLEKGTENQIVEIDKAEATRRLLRNILFFCNDADLVQRVFDSACEFLETVPVYRLAFMPDEKAWDLIQ